MATTDARPIPKKNAAYRVTFPIFDADGDLVSGAANLDSEVSKDGGNFADCTNEATEIQATGIYYLDLIDSEMNADTVAVIVQTSTAGAKTTPVVVYPVAGGIKEIYSDTTIIYSDTTIIYSDTTHIDSDVTALESAVSDVESSLVIVKSDLVVVESDTAAIETDTGNIYSDTTIIYSDTTIIYSDTTHIDSDVTALESAVSDVESSLVIVKSDLVVVESDTAAIETDTGNIYSDTTIIYSDTTHIDSDVTALESAVSDVESSLVIAKSDLVVLDDAVSDVESSLVIVKSDLVEIYSDTAAIHADTGTDGVVISAAEENAIADALLKRDWTAVAGEAARSVLNALRLLRNKASIAGGTLTVTEEDDATAAWTAAVTTDAAADPVTAIDPV